MKCPSCGKEIAEDSLFCEYCGTKLVQDQPKTKKEPVSQNIGVWVTEIGEKLPITKKKWFPWTIGAIAICITAVVVFLCIPRDSRYVNLGLQDGTKWAFSKEVGFYTYEEALAKFGGHLPTTKQFKELTSWCRWVDNDWHGCSLCSPTRDTYIYLHRDGYYVANQGYYNIYGKETYTINDEGVDEEEALYNRQGYYWTREGDVFCVGTGSCWFESGDKYHGMRFSVILVK